MVDIIPMLEEDIKEALKLHSKYIDSGMEVDEHYMGLATEKQYIGIQCVNEEGKMVGSLIYTPGISFSAKHDEIKEDIEQRYPNKIFYTGDVLVIDKAYRNMGLTKPMIEAGRKELKKHGAEYVVGELWIHPDGKIPASMLPSYFKSAKHLYNVPDFYKEYYNIKIKCPVCGDHCKCGAAIYVFEV